MRTAPAMIDSIIPNNFPFTLYFAVPGDINSLTGGYGYDRELIRELKNAGIHVQLLSLSAEFPVPGATALAEAAAIFASLPDGAIVIADGLAFGVMDEIATRESQRLNIIALCHHPLALETGISVQQSHALKISETRALAAAKAVVVTSAMTGRIIARDFAVAPEKIILAYPGTRPQEFAPADHQIPQLLTVATLTKRKGHDLLINALAAISHLPWHARFVGGLGFDSLWVAHLQQLVQKNNLDQRITFVGNVDDISTEFFNADVFVLPSYFEGYGMAFAEALSFGLPVIATHAGAVPDLVPATAGILISPGDVDALTKALEQLLANPDYRRQLQAGAQQAATTLPTWADCAHRIIDLIIRLRNL